MKRFIILCMLFYGIVIHAMQPSRNLKKRAGISYQPGFDDSSVCRNLFESAQSKDLNTRPLKKQKTVQVAEHQENPELKVEQEALALAHHKVMQHERACAEKPKAMACGYCGRSFSTSNEIVQHTIEQHQDKL